MSARHQRQTYRAIGVDIALPKKGLDVVVMDGLDIVDCRARARVADLADLIRSFAADVVAIDSPPAFGLSGPSRLAERELRRLGIGVFSCPPAAVGEHHAFYAWMREGFQAFHATAAAGFPTWSAVEGEIRGHAFEAFPHATAVALRGAAPPRGWGAKKSLLREWRREVLVSAGVRGADELRGLDQVDAALAALTGILALRGTITWLGDPAEGVIGLPVGARPAIRYPREGRPAADGRSECEAG